MSPGGIGSLGNWASQTFAVEEIFQRQHVGLRDERKGVKHAGAAILAQVRVLSDCYPKLFAGPSACWESKGHIGAA